MRERERDEESMREREIDGGVSGEWVRERGRLLEREKDEERRIGKERKSPGKTDVPKLYAYNDCEHSVLCKRVKNKFSNNLLVPKNEVEHSCLF